MSIHVIKSDVPQPLANYSEASLANGLVFAAGQLASDFKTGVPPEARKQPNFPFYGSDIKLQTDYILKNMARTFKAAGTSLDNVIKAQVFLMDLNDFNGFDEVWKQHFKVPPPRTTIGTTGLLVKDTLVEIDLIATLPDKPGKVINPARRSRSQTIPRRCRWAILFLQQASWRAISRQACRRRPSAAKIFPSTGPTFSCRPNSCWKI